MRAGRWRSSGDGAPAVARSRVDRRLAIGLTVLVLLPLLVTLIARIGHTYVPVGDIGTIDLRVRNVWSGNVPLVGPYSRYGWSHPGPWFFYLLAIPNGIFGGAPWTIMVGGLLLQAGAVVWCAVLAWRRGGLPLVGLAMGAMALVYASLPREALLTPWNPYVPVPFFVLFALQCWLLATGERRRLPGATFVAIFIVGTHVGYLPLVAAGAVVAAAYAVVDARRAPPTERWRPWGRPVLWAAVVVAVCLVPTFVDLATNSPTNAGEILRYFTHPESGESVLGLRRAVEVVAAEFRPPFEWLAAQERVDYFSGGVVPVSVAWMLVPVALLAFVVVVARRHRDRGLHRYGVLVVAFVGAGIVAASRITGEPYPYLIKWRPVLAVAVLVAAVAGLALVLGPRVRALGDSTSRVLVAGTGAVVVLALVGGLALDIARHPTPARDLEQATTSIARQLEADGVPDSPVLTRFDTDSGVQLQRGVFDALDRAGFPVRVDAHLAYEVGDEYAATSDTVRRVWWFADAAVPLARLAALPGARVLASYSPLPAAQEREAVALQATLTDQVLAAGRAELLPQLDGRFVEVSLRDVPGVDLRAARRLSALNRRVQAARECRCGVVSLPADTAPATQRDVMAAPEPLAD